MTAQGCRQVVGWLAVGISTVVSCFWAFWGSIENFHEGWFYTSLLMNLAMMVVQYLSPMLFFMGLSLVSLRWPRLGGALHAATAAGAIWFFRGASWKVVFPFIGGPLAFLGACYVWGRPSPRRWAAAVVIGLPLVTLVVCGAEPALRVGSRLDDGYRGPRHLEANGVDLIWAPEGPGWPSHGVSWKEAGHRCRYLNEEGTALANSPQDIWRLPTVEEAVRSQCRGGENCAGLWDVVQMKASYKRKPDKESPLWDIHSKVIYWWTATEVNDQKAHIIVYNGQVHPRAKRGQPGYLGFRAVKSLIDGPSTESTKP
ncbi:MAG TPA: DUF1566 domain-containing protein [Candidatus Hydrogenedentes bacterium]|nr:DUF1566 domain-containing protein [Candidatus Hydrogenedentota bacterium]